MIVKLSISTISFERGQVIYLNFVKILECEILLLLLFFYLAKYSISLDFSTKPYLGFIYYLFLLESLFHLSSMMLTAIWMNCDLNFQMMPATY